MSPSSTPRLSLILCSRNDAYMGNSRWRLETALNYVGDRVQELNRQADVEVLVADWGSDVPLADSIHLRPAAAGIVSFLTVTPAIARAQQGDSPFPEVLALNAAARRARGEFIGRIDQDTLVGSRFLRWFFDRLLDPAAGDFDPAAADKEGDSRTALFFANRRSISYRLAVRCPPLHVIERFIAWFGSGLKIETGRVFYNIDVGIWLLHRDLWHECAGYDERMIYMNDMEIDMATRLMTRYPMVNLGELIGYDFYHLDHYHPGGSRSSSTHRRVNEQVTRTAVGLRPSGDDWGLVREALPIIPARAGREVHDSPYAWTALPVDVLFAGYTWAHAGVDRLVYPFYPVWRRRASIAWQTVRGQSLHRWPALLRRIWIERPSAGRPTA